MKDQPETNDAFEGELVRVLPVDGALEIRVAERPLDPAAAARVADLARGALAAATYAAYREDWADFVAWCATAGRAALPARPGTVMAYLAARAAGEFGRASAPRRGRRVSPARPPALATVDRARAAIAKAHALHARDAEARAGRPADPNPARVAALGDAWQGLVRRLGAAQRPRAPLTTDALAALLAAAAAEPPALAARDRLLLLLGFATGMRRGELAALQVHEVAETAEGLQVAIPRSKTDQAGRGRAVVAARQRDPGRCPVAALRAWYAASGVAAGPVFRRVYRGRVGGALGGGALYERIKQLAARAGLDPGPLGGHSLRAGFVTQARRAGHDALRIARQTGHRSLDMVRRYERYDSPWEGNAGADLDLSAAAVPRADATAPARAADAADIQGDP